MRGNLSQVFVRQLACSVLYVGLSIALPASWASELPKVHSIVFPRFEVSNETRFPPYVELLKAALDRTAAKYGPYQLRPSPLPMNQERSIRELQQGKVDVFWTAATDERERLLLPVRIPIEKGLLSYRVALIAKDHQPVIDQVRTLAGLRKLVIGQGIGWMDTDVYRYNGINVAVANYNSLFEMLSRGRVDLFPRGVGEVFDEYRVFSKSNPGLAIEKNLLIYYPWPYYFFFNRETGRQLAKRVEEGLRMMIRDGSYDRWFQRHYEAAIRRANLPGRRLIRLKNPLLPKNTPLDDPSLWFSPATTHFKEQAY